MVMCCSSGDKHNQQPYVLQIDELQKQAFELIRKQQFDDSYRLAKQAESLSKEENYTKGIAKSFRIQAYYWNHYKQLDSAMYVLQLAEKIEKSLQNRQGLLAVYNTKALLYKKNELYEEALSTYKEGLALVDTNITAQQQSNTHLNIANVYTKKGIYDSAVYHYQQSLLLQTDSVGQQATITYLNLGNVYSLSTNYTLAETYYRKALQNYQANDNIREIAKIYNNLGALYYEKGDDNRSLLNFQKSLQLKEEINDATDLLDTYLNMAELFHQQNTSLALTYLEKAEHLLTSRSDSTNQAKIYIARATIHQQNNNLIKAKNALEMAVKLSKNNKKLPWKRYLMKKQSELAYMEGNYQKAYRYRLTYEALNDSLFNEQKLWEIAELQQSFQSQVKKAEISLLEKDKVLAEQIAKGKSDENKKLYGFLFALSIIICLVLIIAMYFYKLKKAAHQLAKQQKVVAEQKIQNLVDYQELQIINATLAAKEKEKEEIAQELHNNIGSLLTSVKFHFQAFDEKVIGAHETTRKLYEKTNTILDTITDEVRHLSHRFDKNPVPDFNLEEAIVNFSKKVESSQLKVDTELYGLDTFQNSQINIFIFRILQELVNNVLKHAAATLLIITITRNSRHINIMVEDNGKGFDSEQIKKGIGIKNLKKQLTIIEGTCHIDSIRTRGTIITIDIPIY